MKQGPDLATRPQARHEASYELLTHLATGGMAELFIARRHGDASAPHVVLKRVMPEQARNPHFVGMFLDEARLASRLIHPNIAQVLDVGRAGSSYYYTMEYVHGENVRDLLQLAVKRQVLVPLDVCVSVLIGAATGLHAAHETRDRHGVSLGIVHRDVSPSNVMISYRGEIKLVDFGVAKAADHTTETQSGTVKGKIAYLSPEQCTVQPVDRRSDVFSLGIVAYELITRSRLFRRRSDYETMHAIVNDAVPPPSRHRPGVPPAIDAVVARALARAPEDRPQSAADLADELAVVAAGLGLATGPEVLARFMGELFGARPLPWAHLEHHDTAVIALAALAPGLVASELEPLADSVSAAAVAIDVDTVASSSVDRAFAQVITTIAPPPREWGVGEDVPGVFTWPSRDEGIEGVDRTVMTSTPPRWSGLAVARRATGAGAAPTRDQGVGRWAPRIPPPPARAPIGTPSPGPRSDGAFLPTDTVVTAPPPAAAGAAPEDEPGGQAGETTEQGEPGATLERGRVGWLDEVPTTITERTATQRMAATAARAAAASPPAPAALGVRDTIVDRGPRAPATPHPAPPAATLELDDDDDDEVQAAAHAPRAPAPAPFVDPLDPRTTTPRPATRPPMAEPMAPPPMAWPAVDPRTGPHAGPDPLLPGPPPPSHGSRRVLVVVGLGVLAGGGLALVASLALRAPPRPATTGSVGGALAAPDLGADRGGSVGGDDLDAIRARARAARTDGRWADAYGLCRAGLRLAADDAELAAICAHAACAAHDPAAAHRYLRRLPAGDVEVAAASRRCVELGLPDPARP